MISRQAVLGLLGAAVVVLAQGALGADGTWSTAGSGAWTNTGNWSGGNVADGTNATADFSTLNLTSGATVTLDTSPTIGTLRFGDTTPSHDWTLMNAALTLATTTVQPVIDVSNNTLTVLSVLQGTRGFVKTGNGQLVIRGNNTVRGDIDVVQGTLYSGFDGLYYTSGRITVSTGATLILSSDWGGHYNITNPITLFGNSVNDSLVGMGNFACSGPITLAGDSRIIHNWNYFSLDGQITGAGKNLELAITVSGQPEMYVNGSVNLGTGMLTVDSVQDGGGVSVVLTASNTYSGGTVLTNYANLQLGNVGALGSGGVTLYQNSQLNLSTRSVSIAWLSGPGGIITDTGAAGTTTLTVTQSVNTTYSGTISNGASRTVALTKSGSGTLTLAGTNTYSGITVVSSGTLVVNGAYSSDTNGFLLSDTGLLGGTGTIERAVTVADTTAIDPGSAAATLGTLIVSSNISFNSDGGLITDIAGTSSDFLQVSGNVTVSGGAATVLPRGAPGTCHRWIIMRAEGGITGNFRSLNPKYGVAIEGNDLVLQRCFDGTCIIIK